MRLRERPVHELDHEQPLLHDDAAPQTVDAWLEVFDRLLRLPGTQKSAIREELRSHLTDRVRDLTLSGLGRERAMRQAISELGEAAELAEQFRHANRYPRRRLIMNGALIGISAAAIVTTAAMVTQGNGGGASVEPAVFDVPERRAEHVDTLESVDVRVAPDMSLRQIFGVIGDTEQLAVSVNWSALQDWGVSVDEPLGLGAATLSVHRILGELDRRIDEWGQFDWRLEGRLLSIDTKESFDVRERLLASYDIEPILDSMIDRYDLEYEWATAEIASVIQELVEPEQWQANGGHIAQLRIVGGRMFVQAPLRTHEKVSWILGELAKDGAVNGKPQARGGAAEPSVMPNPSDEWRVKHEMNQNAMVQLRNIHMAWQIWQQAHQGRPLERLQQLVDGGMLRPRDLRSPHGPASDGVDYWLDYGAADLGPNVDLSKRIVGIDRSMYESADLVATVFADGHVELLPIEQLRSLLAMPGNADAKPDLPPRREAKAEHRAVQHFQLAHVDAQELGALLKAALDADAEIVVDPRSNSILLQAMESRLEPWTALLARLDRTAAAD